MEDAHVSSAAPRHTQAPEACLAGGGEMGARMRAFDWAHTPVGPLGRWPQSLKTAVQILLGSRYPMFVWWGQEFIQFYNDAYAPMLGTRHPQALGQPAPVVWADVWGVVGPQAEAVLHAGQSSWNEELLLIMERYGYPEETYFTFSYSPVADDTGGVGGVFCAVTEETGRVLGQRRLRTLQALAAAAVGAKSVEDTCALAAQVLAENRADVPFALLYLLDRAGELAQLAGTVGLAAGAPGAPLQIDLTVEADGGWPLRRVMESGASTLVEDLVARVGPMPGGPWSDSPQHALVLPLAQAGQEQLAGFLVAGLSPRLAFDDDYRGFLGLLANHMAAAIADARAYEAERQRAEALAELDRAKTAFFSNVSHEFRTPLTLMLGPLEQALADEYGALTPPQRGELAVVHRNGLRLLKLVNTLLDFSRIEAGRIEASYAPTDLAAVTADLASVFRSAIERAGLGLVVECPPLPDAVYVDRDMWEKIVLNLLSNAFKFTFAGEIAVSLSWGGNHVALRVRDTGTGIPAHELSHLFERFHRIPNARARTYEGTGIGLALVQELVQLHGGQITVASEVGVGTTFTVTMPTGTTHLPADRVGAARRLASTALGTETFVEEALRWLPDAPAGMTVSGAAVTPAPPGARTAAPARILLVDDNADMREYVRRLLSPHWEVVAVADGLAALEAVRTRVPDLVLADVMMPGLDGFALLRALRADPHTATLSVILLSARAGEEARVEGLEAGADDYLIKPFSARELLARVRAQLDLARVRREAETALRDSERRFREMIDALPAAIYTTDTAGRLTHFNPAAVAFSGRVPELGTDQWCVSWKLYYPDGTPMPHDACPMALTLKEGRAVRGAEAIVERPDGTRRWFAPYPTPLRDSAGRIVGGINMLMDITERKQAEEALRESQDHITRLNAQLRADLANMTRLQHVSTRLVQTGDFSALLDEILDAAIAITGADMGNIQLLDGDTLKIVAQRGFDAPFLAFFNAVHDGLAACGTAMQRGERVIVEDVATSPLFAGSPACDVMLAAQARAVQSTPLITRAGRLLGMFSTHYRTPHRPDPRELGLLDLLARQAADGIERVQAEAVRERLAAIVDASDAAIIGKTLEGVITSWNHGAERLYGYTAAEAIGQPIGLLVPPDMPDELPQILAQLQRGERIDHYETQRVHKDGTRLDVALTISPIRDSTGRVIGASKIARDITARKQAAAELERRRQETALLAEIAQHLGASLDLDTVLQRVVTGAQELCGSERVFLALREPGTDTLVGRYEVGAPQMAYAGFRIMPGQGLGGQVLRTGQPWRTEDYAADPRFGKEYLARARAGGHLAVLAVPILIGARVEGLLYASNPATHPLTDRDEAILVRLATHAAMAIQNAQLYQQAQQELAERQTAEAALARAAAELEQRVAERTALLALIQDVTRAANEALTSAVALQYALDRLCAYTGWPIGHVYLAVVPGADRWAPTALWHLDVPERFTAFQQATQGLEFAAGEGLIGRVGAHGQPEWQSNVATDPAFERRHAAQAVGLTTGVAWPILVGNEVAGVLEFYTPEPLAPTPILLEAMTQIGTQLGRVIERERAAERVQRQQEALLQHEKLAAMSTMLASVAHELNNPLATILLQAELVGEDVREGPLAEPVTEIAQAAQRCERLVRQFLTLARQHPPERSAVALNTLVAETVELLAYPLRVDNVAVHLHLDEQVPPLWGDPHQLQQVLINLLTNAQQALRTASGTREVTLTTQYDPTQQQITLAVTDTGPGIPLALQGRIFEPFFTTKPPGVGTGLGLSLCRGILETHGGTLEVTSAPGHGATFRLTLPVGAVPAPLFPPPPTDAGRAVRGGMILVVDDERSLATGLARLLRRDGHTVDIAVNGRLALTKLDERAYDLILCDMRMPELDGPSLYRLLERQQPQLCKRLIFLTGDTLEPATREFLEQSGASCLTKPFPIAEARRVIQRALTARAEEGPDGPGR